MLQYPLLESLVIHYLMSPANSVMRRALALYSVPIVLLLVCNYRGADGDDAKDRAECTDQLAGLATCLPFVEGEARAPTLDCCGGLKEVLRTSKKCLCVIAKDGNDPQLGLNINVTLALSLPSVCQAPANVSQCPALLHLDPHSAEAQVFYQYGSKGTAGHVVASSPSPSPVLGEGPTSAPAAVSGGDAAPQQSDGTGIRTGPMNAIISSVVAGCALFLWPTVF